MSNQSKWILLFLLLFFFRLGFGLLESKWSGEDQFQTYLIGLKCYTTGTWPYFGPDVNGIENQSVQNQIPGALEGLLISLPLHILPIPEAPYIFLNLMSTAGAALLAWYICARIPKLSFPLLFLWISICPWSLHEGTTILNPPFNFLPSVLFCVGFLETLPAFSLKLIPRFWANAFMGFAVFWVMQIHFSYVYLLPLAAFSLLTQVLKEGRWRSLLDFTVGSLPMAALILPTYFRYGFTHGNASSGFAVPFNLGNALEFHTILGRFLSLVCFEVPRFIGEHNSDRFAFLLQHPAILVPGTILWAAGILQAVVLFLFWFKKDNPVPRWKAFKILILAVLVMVWVSFWFTVKLPMSHIYFVLFPLVMIYSCYVWSLFVDNPAWGWGLRVFLILGLGFQAGYAIVKAPQDSLYTQRAVVAKAIQEKNYHVMGERRSGSLY